MKRQSAKGQSHPRVAGDGILGDLEARGLLQDHTDRVALAAQLAEGTVTLYCGFDPTADSLHIGNLVPLLTLQRFQRFGHRPIALAGGATGMIGDPSGRSDERNLLDDDALAHNLEQIVPQLRRFLDFDPGPAQARLYDNRAWTVGTSIVEFLREVGKHVTVNQMIAKDSVKSRLHSARGISYTEFSYMLLQANDFLRLHELEGCTLQIGGSDQWGNITAGIDLIRRRLGASAHGLTMPLLTRADGSKYGKTAAGEQLWLGAHRMSPYRFYQGWMQADDADVAKLLLRLTFLEPSEATQVASEHDEHPERRDGQRRVAHEVTAIVHGPAAAAAAAAASRVLFGEDPVGVDEATWTTIGEEVPLTTLSRDRFHEGVDPIDLFVEAGLASSRGDARRTLEGRGYAVNNFRAEVGMTLGADSLFHGRYLLLRKGKATYHLVKAV